MTDDSKPRSVYIKLQGVDFDLGDWKVVPMSAYPHVESTRDATKFVEASAYDALAAKLKEAEAEREMFADRDRQSWEIRRDMSKEIKKLKDELTAERARSERLEGLLNRMINKTNVLSMHVRGAPMSKEDLQEAIETVYERQCEAEKALAEHDGNGEK